MAKRDDIAGSGAGDRAGIAKLAMVFAAAAGITLAMPSAGFALGGTDISSNFTSGSEFAPFTPATVDPQLARRVAASIRAKGLDIGFTPAATNSPRDRTVTVAIRVDDQTARAISVRSAAVSAQSQVSARSVTIAPTRYNLGIARGYQGFAKAPALSAQSLPAGVSSVEMPDLADFKPSEGTSKDKPSRFQPRITLEQGGNVGRSPRTLNALGEQSVDLGGAYRVTKNLNVTAGVRLSQESDRLDPLTDNVQDSQAVYVGTQFRF